MQLQRLGVVAWVNLQRRKMEYAQRKHSSDKLKKIVLSSLFVIFISLPQKSTRPRRIAKNRNNSEARCYTFNFTLFRQQQRSNNAGRSTAAVQHSTE